MDQSAPRHPGALIKPSGTGYTRYNKLITDNRAGTNPDISEIEYQALPEMVANHVAISLDKYAPDLSQKYGPAVPPRHLSARFLATRKIRRRHPAAFDTSRPGGQIPISAKG